MRAAENAAGSLEAILRDFPVAVDLSAQPGVFSEAVATSDAAGRAFAAYGGVYICASLVWMAMVEKTTPDRWDLNGAAVCMVGAGIILFGQRG